MAQKPAAKPENATNQGSDKAVNQPTAKLTQAGDKPTEAPGVKPTEARKDLTDATNKTVTAETAASPEDQELVNYVESLDVEPGFKQLLLLFAKLWTSAQRIASNFSLFDDLDKTPKGVKLKPEEEVKIKALWQKDLAKADQATIDRLNKLGNEAAATSYVCVALGIGEIVDPGVLLEALDNVKMDDNRGFTRVSDLGILTSQKPDLKKGTIVFTNFNLLTGQLIPCIATGNGGELKMLYPNLKSDKKEGNLPKVEQSIYLYGGEPNLTRFQFRAALVPNFVTSAGEAVVDAKDDTSLGKILGYESKTRGLREDVTNSLAEIADLQDSPTANIHAYKISRLNHILEPLNQITSLIEDVSVNYRQIVESKPEFKEKILEKFTAAANGYKELLTKAQAGIDQEIAKLKMTLDSIVNKIAYLEGEAKEGEELKTLKTSRDAISAKIKDFEDLKPKFVRYKITDAKLDRILAIK